jgi:hypothetical protein
MRLSLTKFDSITMTPSNAISVMSVIPCTSGRLHSELVCLLFLQTHRETDRFFAALGVQVAESDRGQFHYLLRLCVLLTTQV